MKRTAMLLIVLSGMAQAAEPLSADAAMTNYRDMIGGVSPQASSCPASEVQDEIVVCARPKSASPYRLPLPDERPGRIVRGELARADSVNDKDGGPHGKAGGINLIGLGSWLYGLASEAIESDE